MGVGIALGVGLLLLRRIQRRGRGVAPVQRSQERFEKSELHNSSLPRTHGRAELEARGPVSELEGTPAEGRKTLHKAEEVFEKEPQPTNDEIVTDHNTTLTGQALDTDRGRLEIE